MDIPKYKRHHFVPKAIIKRFSVSGKVSLYETARLGKSPIVNPRSIFAIDHLYSRWDGEGVRDYSHEFSFKQDHEDEIPRRIDQTLDILTRSESIPRDHCEYFTNLTIRLLLRNPKFIESFQRNWGFRLAKWLVRAAVSLNQKAKAAAQKSGMSPRDMAEAQLRAMSATADISRFLEIIRSNYSVRFYVPDDGCRSFILGNQAVLMQRRRWTPADQVGDSFQDGRYEFHTVVDPRLMISLYPNEIVAGVHVSEINDSDIQRINGLIIKYCEEILIRDIWDVDGAWYRLFDGEDRIRKSKGLSKEIDRVEISVRA